MPSATAMRRKLHFWCKRASCTHSCDEVVLYSPVKQMLPWNFLFSSKADIRTKKKLKSLLHNTLT